MQTVSEVMIRDVRFVAPRESLQRAAQMMDELNVDILPVCDGERLVGMVTDRDVGADGSAAGPDAAGVRVEEVMSTDVRWCFEDQPLDEVMRQMAGVAVRGVPVVSHDDARRLVGIVALDDAAAAAREGGRNEEARTTPEDISLPSGSDPSRPDAPNEKDLSAIAPTAGTSAGPGSTESIGHAAGNTLGAPGAGRTDVAGGTNAPGGGTTGAAGRGDTNR